MEMLRRRFITFACSSLAASVTGNSLGFASTADRKNILPTSVNTTHNSDIVILAPEIIGDGNTVPITIVAPDAVLVSLFAEDNPVPDVATFKFGPLCPSGKVTTRIRLAKTQKVKALAQLNDGTFVSTQATIKVTIGGCGG